MGMKLSLSHRFGVCENRVLRTIAGPKGEKGNRKMKTITEWGLGAVKFSPNIMRKFKSRRAHMGET